MIDWINFDKATPQENELILIEYRTFDYFNVKPAILYKGKYYACEYSYGNKQVLSGETHHGFHYKSIFLRWAKLDSPKQDSWRTELPPFDKRVLVEIKDLGVFFGEFTESIIGRHYWTLYQNSVSDDVYGMCANDYVARWREIDD